jgi:hypothetical protein
LGFSDEDDSGMTAVCGRVSTRPHKPSWTALSGNFDSTLGVQLLGRYLLFN